MLPNAKAKKLLEDYCITNPKKINLEEIANAENLIVEEEELKSHLGRITCGDGYGLIKISSTLESTGAKRFTLAHEMGHYFNEELKMNNYKLKECSISDLLSYKSVQAKENEANEFAAELLMHKPCFSDYIRSRKINMELIKDTANYFYVSLTATAIRYAEIGKYPVAVILSKDGKVQWSSCNEYFPLKFIPKGYFVRKESIAYDYFEKNEVQTDVSRRNGVKTEYDMVPAHTWFSQDNKCPDDLYFYEHSVVMKRARKITYTKEDYSMRVLSGKK